MTWSDIPTTYQLPMTRNEAISCQPSAVRNQPSARRGAGGRTVPPAASPTLRRGGMPGGRLAWIPRVRSIDEVLVSADYVRLAGRVYAGSLGTDHPSILPTNGNGRFGCQWGVAVIVTMSQDMHNLSGSLWSPPPTSQARPPPPSKEPREEPEHTFEFSTGLRGGDVEERDRGGNPTGTTQLEPSNATTSPYINLRPLSHTWHHTSITRPSRFRRAWKRRRPRSAASIRWRS